MSRIDKKVYYERRRQSKREIENLWGELKGCRKVLDVGCGAGYLGMFRPSWTEVYGIDNDSSALEAASQNEITKLHDVRKRLPFKDSFFDGVLVKHVFEHLLEPWVLLKDIRRVLKKEGIVVALVPAPRKRFWDDYTHVRPFTEISLSEMFKDCRFEVIHLKRTRGIPGFGLLGLNKYVPYLLRLPFLGFLSDGYLIKARKR